MNYAAQHEQVTINTNEGSIILKKARLMVSGDFLVINLEATRDEENNIKTVETKIIPLSTITSYVTDTKYYPERGLSDEQEILKS
tara:strand:- start:141 stop:395 length:255 start_codon:yes stop_codon:yes gene_type:complete